MPSKTTKKIHNSQSRTKPPPLNLSTPGRLKEAIGKKEDLFDLLKNAKDSSLFVEYSKSDYCTLLYHCVNKGYSKGLTQIILKIIEKVDNSKEYKLILNKGRKAQQKPGSFSNLTKALVCFARDNNGKDSENNGHKTKKKNQTKDDRFNFIECALILIVAGCDVDYPALIELNSKNNAVHILDIAYKLR